MSHVKAEASMEARFLQTELETLSFAITSPLQFASISSALDATRASAEPALAAAQAQRGTGSA